MNRFPKNIFREYDIRGIADIDLSVDVANALGKAFAEKVIATCSGDNKNPTVSVGKDCRLTSDQYAAALIEGIISRGVNVIELGTVPTPLTYYSIFRWGLDGGIMVTGSHNPPNYNGFKISIGKSTLHGSDIQNLRSMMENSDTLPICEKKGALTSKLIDDLYISELVLGSKIGPNKKKIVLDSGNGAASKVAPALFKKLGAEVIPLFCEFDGRFPNHHPDPTIPENLKQLIETVKENKADFGIAFDGDADRIGVVDEAGNIIYGDELMVLFSRDVLKNHPGSTIISEVKSSHRLYADIQKNGGNGIMWKTGHSLIKSKMKETSATLAGEMSGHIFFADRYYGYDDAIYAALRLYEIASRSPKPLSTWLSDLPKSFSTPEIRVDCHEELKFQLVEFCRKSAIEKGWKLNDIDGIRVDFNDGWGLIRASNTQPVIVLRFESETEDGLRNIQKKLTAELIRAGIALGHPPFAGL
jgi:phosphomannomutase/phosphoglucomutase